MRLRIFKEAAALRPATSHGQTADSQPKSNGHRKSGRQPGSLSKEWRAILKAMNNDGNAPREPSAIAEVSKKAGHPVDVHTVRDRMRKYAEFGFVERVGNAYRVAAKATERFGFMQ